MRRSHHQFHSRCTMKHCLYPHGAQSGPLNYQTSMISTSGSCSQQQCWLTLPWTMLSGRGNGALATHPIFSDPPHPYHAHSGTSGKGRGDSMP
ncbi:hypothetical protein GQ55_8G259300 [Panicum hallii var. hallii]|uniref:Uncharacterized protein n=1 Tax=Panicum hallii var. hallii TaxID=1504633 RepID=A0A2T7CRA6_9POAL|nr:hypothetical protein GQ55_8G259300 [Panicum hallii var. hallii]